MDEKEIKIEDINDAKDVFSLAVVLNGLMDKFESVESVVGSHDKQIAKLCTSVEALNEQLSILIAEVKKLNDKTEVADANMKLRKDNVTLNKKLKELEGKTPAKPKEKPVEPAPALEPVKPPKEDVTQKIIDEAKKCIESVKKTKKKLYLFNDMKGNYKDQKFAKAVYEYLKTVGFITDGGKILDRDAKI